MAVIKISSSYGVVYARPFEFIDCTKVDEAVVEENDDQAVYDGPE